MSSPEMRRAGTQLGPGAMGVIGDMGFSPDLPKRFTPDFDTSLTPHFDPISSQVRVFVWCLYRAQDKKTSRYKLLPVTTLEKWCRRGDSNSHPVARTRP